MKVKMKTLLNCSTLTTPSEADVAAGEFVELVEVVAVDAGVERRQRRRTNSFAVAAAVVVVVGDPTVVVAALNDQRPSVDRPPILLHHLNKIMK